MNKRNFSSLLLGCVLSAMFLPVDAQQLLSNFAEYHKTQLQEKIFVHIDRSLYLTGETMWLKIYCVDGTLHRPLDVSRVGYVEIIDAEKKSLLQTKIELKDGTGEGALFLPVSLNTGRYWLRSYTNWMKNSDPGLFYQQEIELINPFINLPLKPAGEIPAYDLQFFPEGGHLVAGLPGVVAFKASGTDGRGVDFTGAILDGKNDTVARLRPSRFGIGKFSFTPDKDEVYRAVAKISGKSYPYAFPKIAGEGETLHLTDAGTQIRVDIQSTSDNPALQLLVHTRRKLIFHARQILNNGSTSFSINKDALSEGISHFTLFNAKLEPLCERLYFKKPVQKIDLTLQSSSAIQTARKKVDINIDSKLPDGTGTAANLSVAIYRIDSLDERYTNIIHHLFLMSELKGHIESPEYYFRDTDVEAAEATDRLMLTHGWSRFKWEDITSGKKSNAYVAEHGGHFIEGKITETTTKNPAEGIVTYLATPGVDSRPYFSTSKAGKISFEVKDFYGNKEIVVQTNQQRDSTYSIEIFSPFAEARPAGTLPWPVIGQRSKEIITSRSLHMQVQNIFRAADRSGFVPTPARPMFYGKPDERYLLDAYTRFVTMEEVMREYIKGVLVRKRQGRFHFYNLDYLNKDPFRGEPFVIIDGVPVFDTDRIMAFDPRKVEALEVVGRKYYLGPLVFDGVVNYQTYDGDLGGFQPDARSLIMSYEGLQAHREFYSPVYETEKQIVQTQPDTRHLLYWSPNINTDADGKAGIHLYTSDIAGLYRVVVQGITRDGIPGHATVTFEVKDDSGN